MLRQSDRKTIDKLVAILPNHRDASGSSTTLWREDPTPINPPGSQRQPSARKPGGNPYSGRLSSNLNNKQVMCRNPVSRQTLFSIHPHSPAAKRRKVETSGRGARASHESVSQVNGEGRAIRRMDNPREIISVEDGDEDLGKRVMQPHSSPDPIDTIPSGTISHSLERPDGPSTAAVKTRLSKMKKAQLVDDSEPDGIESANFFDDQLEVRAKVGSETIPVRSGNVRDMVTLYEEPRHVDLASEWRKKGNMQGKVPSKNSLRPERDPIATSSSDFSHGRIKKLKDPHLHALPVEAWYFGTKRFPDKSATDSPLYWLLWEGTSTLIVKQGPLGPLSKLHVNFLLDRQVQSLQYTQADFKEVRGVVIVHMSTPHFPLKEVKALSSYGQHFKPGGGDAGKLIFNLKSDHQGWSSIKYQQLVTFLRKAIKENSSLNSKSSSVLWQTADNSDTAALPRKRKATHRSPSPLDSQLRTDLVEVPTTSRNGPETVSALHEDHVFGSLDTFEATLARPERSQVSRYFPKTSAITQPAPETAPANHSRPTLALKGTGQNVTEPSEPRRSTRQSVREIARPSPPVDPDELILVYPPDTAGAVNITNADLARLEPNEFLNDTLIEFGLKLWLNELRGTNPELAESIHVFSSFFYKKLNNKNLAEGYQSVRKWTSRIDLFKKKYIIIPINENLHWYLAVIYHPEHILLPPPYQALRLSTRGRAARAGHVSDEPTKYIPPPQDTPDENTSDPPSHTLSDSQHEEEISALLHFGESCSISPGGDSDNENPTLPVSLPISAQKADESTITEPATSNIDEDELMLQWPSSPHDADTMDVDVPPEVPSVGVRRRGTSTERESIESASSCGKSNNVQQRAAGSATLRNGVSPTNFYGSVSDKGKQKATPMPHPFDIPNEGEQEVEIDELIGSQEPSKTEGRPMAYIFTLDSLGTRHMQAIRILKQYLSMEAKDKKGIGECSEAQGKHALVPVQPNYCDCGLYLLHFAETFMRNPDHYCDIILTRKNSSHITERQADWDDAGVRKLRGKLTAKVIELSEQWKRDRALKEERRKETAESKEGEKVESSDDEIDIVEDVQMKPVSATVKGKGKGKGKATYSKTKVPLSKAERLR